MSSDIIAFSKGELDRLGERIRKQQPNLDEQTLLDLQTYRTMHREALSNSFNYLCLLAKKSHPTTIVTYRIKRFESIISKLDRMPEMRFSRMWDIAGCRVIARSNHAIQKMIDTIRDDVEFTIVKEKNYIISPQEDGYRSHHIFIKHKNCDKIIEVQFRNKADHNWATLVEITDLVFDTRLKECDANAGDAKTKELRHFHYLLSKEIALTLKEKKEIARVIRKYSYIKKLSEIFARNYLTVRRQWFAIESKNNHKYYLIESSKNEVPRIESFDSSVDAENKYFTLYKSKQNANIVLTHLQTPNYDQISVAYSNYILTFHTFLDECYVIFESLLDEALKKRKYYFYIRIFNIYNDMVYNSIRDLITETNEFRKVGTESKNDKSLALRQKEKDWMNAIVRQINKGKERRNKLKMIYRKHMPRTPLGGYFLRTITQFIVNKYKRKLKKLNENSANQ